MIKLLKRFREHFRFIKRSLYGFLTLLLMHAPLAGFYLLAAEEPGLKNGFVHNMVLLNPQQENIKISGTVIEAETGNPIPGANVYEEGTTNGTITDINGKYTINVRSESSVLVFSFIGYSSQNVLVGLNRMIDIQLKLSAEDLEEVVVVGYGSQMKISVTGSISTINAEEIIRSPVSSVQNALAGRATGVITIQRSSEPGRDFADIYIRGQATYGNSSPLILVDGIERDITTIDPNEIQSINILKDASSTAVFGVRGANGVIVVTTKTGHQSSRPQISFSANYGMSSPLRIPGFLEADEWAKFFNMGSRNDNVNDASWTAPFSDAAIALYASGEDPVFHPNTDWVDLLVRDYVPQQQYNLNMSGGTEKARYFVSLGYFSQVGAFKNVEVFDDFPVNSSIERYNIRANTDFDWNKNFSTSIKFSTQISSGNYPSGANMNSLLNNVFTSSPIVSPPLIDGKIIYDTPELSTYKIAANPIQLFYSGGFQISYQARTTVDVTSVYKLDSFVKGLSVRGKFAYDNLYGQNTTRNRNIDMYEARRTGTNIADDYYSLIQVNFSGPWYTANQGYNQNYRLYSEAAMNYNRTISGGHTITGLFLGTMERSFRGGFPALPFNYMGLVGRATYNYKRKYMAEANMGYNGSENFAKGKQFGFFPSFSLGYVISEESFFPENNVLTFVKLRGSNGKVGNDKVGGGNRFLYTPSSYGRTGGAALNYRFGDAYTLVPGGYEELKIGNPDISWEVAEKSNIGVELKFFSDNVSLVGDWFKEKRTGILGDYNNIPFTFGDINLLPSFNLGIVENKGYELELEYSHKKRKNFSYWLNANYTFAKNKVVYFDEIIPEYPNLIRTGQPIGQPFMLLADGLYNTWDEVNDPNRIPTTWDAASPVQPGDVRYVDINKDGIINGNDITVVGYSNVPEIVYGITAGLRWMNFDLSILFQGAENVSTYYGNKTVFASGYGARTEAAYDCWTEEKYLAGEQILYPRISLLNTGTANTQMNSMLNQDASYLRIKNLEIGYNFKNSFTRKFGSEMLRIYFNGQNLATFTKMKYWDPEMVRNSNEQYPMTRMLNFGVKANF